MEDVETRLKRLLVDPHTGRAAALVGARWLAGELDATAAGESLDFIEAEAQKARLAAEPPPPPPEPKERAEFDQRLRRMLADGAPREVLAPLVKEFDSDPVTVAQRAVALEASLLDIRRGDKPALDLMWRGEWTAGARYQPGDVATVDGSSYVAVIETTVRAGLYQPGWKPLALKSVGVQGPPGPAGAAGASGVTDHGDLTGVTADQHHAKAHTVAEHTSAVSIRDEGAAQGDVHTFDFVGAGITAAVAGGVATVTVTATGSGGDEPSVTDWIL